MSEVALEQEEDLGGEVGEKDGFVESPESEEGALFPSSASNHNSSLVPSSLSISSSSELLPEELNGGSGSANGDCLGRKLTLGRGNVSRPSVHNSDIISIV